VFISLYIFIAIVIVFLFYVFSNHRRPWRTESDLSNHIPGFFHFYYSTKYWHQVKRAEKGKGVEELFANTKSPTYSNPLKDSTQFTIGAVGDLMMRPDLAAPKSPHLWDEVSETLFTNDFASGNFELSVNPERKIYRPVRYAVQEHHAIPIIPKTKFGSFDYVSLANNHINDSEGDGICKTIDFVKNEGLLYSGAAKTAETQDDFPIVDIKGAKVAFLSFTFSTNGRPLEDDFQHGTNVVRFNAINDANYNPSIIHRQIALAKERGAELIVANNHWGIEFEYYPRAKMVDRAHELMDAGIDIIIGHHPHILNPSEWYTTKDGRNSLILYSLGNLTAQLIERPVMRMAQIAKISIEAGENENGEREVRLIGAEFTPTYFSLQKRWGPKADHRLLPLFETEKKILAGETVAHNGVISKWEIKGIAEEYRKHFMQKDAFAYK
jgi:poly-gamma-glutamate capsule biosynthesis protein CapA/YwtB (metallophosphatase superfamily)